MMAYWRWIVTLGIIFFTASVVHAATQNDTYIAGYATGVLKHQLMLNIPALVVQDGVITLPAASLVLLIALKLCRCYWQFLE